MRIILGLGPYADSLSFCSARVGSFPDMRTVHSDLFCRCVTSLPLCHFASLSCPCSALIDLADKVKGIIHPVTGLPMPFICGVCVRAFLPPAAAADEYLCTITHAPAELDFHSEAAALGRTRNTRRTRVLSCGVVVGVCTSCDAYRSPPRGRTRRQCGPCTSRQQPASSSSPAKCTPGPGAIPHLWTPTTADQERASSPAERTKVCSGCKTGAERDASVHASRGRHPRHPAVLR